MKFSMVRLITSVSLAKEFDSTFYADRGVAITLDGPFIRIQKGEAEVLTPFTNVIALYPEGAPMKTKKAQEKQPEPKAPEPPAGSQLQPATVNAAEKGGPKK